MNTAVMPMNLVVIQEQNEHAIDFIEDSDFKHDCCRRN